MPNILNKFFTSLLIIIFLTKFLNMKIMENDIDYSNSKLTTEKALQMLNSEGLEVTLEQAEEILYFLRIIANIAVLKRLNKRK
ncbi:hypothetical protein AP058_01554 [Flavobacterium sp. TAB 87]|nr:hypothetical protein AP058_01554 [Flavobacterium sp. TAB 87]